MVDESDLSNRDHLVMTSSCVTLEYFLVPLCCQSTCSFSSLVCGWNLKINQLDLVSRLADDRISFSVVHLRFLL